MIANISLHKSFRHDIGYCFKDKRHPATGEVMFQERAELICSNYCYGSAKELVKQFEQVYALNSRITRPVMHIVLSLSAGEQLPRHRLIQIVQDLAKDMNFQQHQYIAISHRDTNFQHVHVVANKIGFDGRCVDNSFNYYRLMKFCREMELKYRLQSYCAIGKRSAGQEYYLETLRRHVHTCISTSDRFEVFEAKMKTLGYKVWKKQGICFIDAQNRKVKGKDIGFPLFKIERLLAVHHQSVEAKSFIKEKSAADLLSAIVPKQAIRRPHHHL